MINGTDPIIIDIWARDGEACILVMRKGKEGTIERDFRILITGALIRCDLEAIADLSYLLMVELGISEGIEVSNTEHFGLFAKDLFSQSWIVILEPVRSYVLHGIINREVEGLN